MKGCNLIKATLLMLLLAIMSTSTSSMTAIETSDPLYIIVNPDQNIQEIITSSPPYSKIVLNPGVYQQPITIQKSISIAGKDPNLTFLNIKTNPNNAAITLQKKDTVLSNVTITNTAEGLYTTAIRINAPNCTIENCTVRDTPIGIAAWSSHTNIRYNSFYNCSDEGILLISTSISNSNYNHIRNCHFENNCDAIELQYSSYNVIEHCTISQNTHSGIDAICNSNDYNLIDNCTIENNTVHGIYFSSSKENIISNCYFSNNGEDNVLFAHSSYKNSMKDNVEQSTETMANSQYSEVETKSNFTSSLSQEDSNFGNGNYTFLQRIQNLLRNFRDEFLKFRNNLGLF